MHSLLIRKNSDAKRAFLSFLIMVATLLFQSCELEPNPTGNNIEIQVLNFEGFTMYPGNLSSINLCVGNYPLYQPDYLGFCRIENVYTPYSLQVARGQTVSYYKKLNINSPKIVIIDGDGPNSKKINLFVKFPAIEHGKSGIVHFISKDMFEQDIGNTYFIDEYCNSTNIKVEIPADKESISGKLIFIQCAYTEYYYLDIYDYYNFGIKDVTLHTGYNDTAEFSQHDIELDPEEISSNINVIYPEQYTNYYMDIYLSFPGYSKGSDINIGYYPFTNFPITQVVPAALSIPFNIKIESYCWNYVHYWSYKYKNSEIVHIQPGQSIDIRHDKTNLLSPQNNEEGIHLNSVLKAEDDGERGVYLFYIGLKGDSFERGVRIYTDKNEIILNDNINNFKLLPDTWYEWNAGKYSSFVSIDDFVSEPYITRENYHSFKFSDKRFFKTAP